MFSALIIMLGGLMTLSSAQIFTPEQTAKIEDFVTGVMQCVQVPGLTLAVVKGNQTWTHGFGFADVSQNRTVNSSTLFGIGSITKAFTTTLLSMNMENNENKYTWTSKIVDILGEDFKFVDEMRTKETTVRDILSHRTGLLAGNIGLFSGFLTNTTRKQMASRLRYLEELKSFRDDFTYNNWMYALAGYLTDIISGKSWEEELKSKLFEPLGMTDSRIIGYDITVSDDNMAKPYVMVDNEVIPSSPQIYKITPGEPAGAIASSADDMSKWIRLMLNKGNTTDGQQLVDWQTLQDAFKPHITLPSPQKKPVFPIADINQGYGYGWFVSNHDGYTKYHHSGGLYGYVAMLWFFPDLDFGFFGNTNGPGTSEVSKVFRTIFPYLFDLLMDKEPWLNKSTACTYPLPWSPKPADLNSTADVTNQPIEHVNRYVGEYGNKLFGDIQITAEEDNKLYFQINFLQGYLNSTDKENTFKMEVTDDFTFFTRPNDILHLVPVVFEDKDSKNFYQSLTVELEEKQPCRFYRGLKWADDTNPTDASSKFQPNMLVIAFCILMLLIQHR